MAGNLSMYGILVHNLRSENYKMGIEYNLCVTNAGLFYSQILNMVLLVTKRAIWKNKKYRKLSKERDNKIEDVE